MSGCLLIQWVKHEVTLQLPCADHWSFVLRYESTRHWVEAKCMYKTNKNSKYTEVFITLWSWQTKQNKENMLYDNAKHQKSPARPQGFIRPQKNNKVLNVCLMKRDKKKRFPVYTVLNFLFTSMLYELSHDVFIAIFQETGVCKLSAALAKRSSLHFPFSFIFCLWKGFKTHVSKIV